MTECNPSEMPTYEDICTFCREAKGEKNVFMDLGITEKPSEHILLESDHFAVVPCVGALTDWYVLIVPHRHVLSTGWMTPQERAELKTMQQRATDWLAERSQHEVVTFEHGSFNFRDKGGACHDHAHIHVVATPRPVSAFVDYVSDIVKLRKCSDWIDEAADTVAGSLRSYLALSSREEDWIARSDNAPSGFFRKALARWLGEDAAQHDWIVFPQAERLRMMVTSKQRQST